MSFGALIIAHNVIEHDYCIRECILSVLPLCDRVLVVECESTDGTLEMLDQMAIEHPRIRIIQHPWKPSLNLEWLREITAYTKGLIGTDWYIAMDADEVIDPEAYCDIQGHIKRNLGSNMCASMYRYTFWNDTKHIIPHGIICNHICPRIGPTTESLCGDLILPQRTTLIPAKIYHYGHLRKRDAWVTKSVKCHQWAFGEVPEHWKRAENGDMSGIAAVVPDSILLRYDAPHPEVIRPWLLERGYYL